MKIPYLQYFYVLGIFRNPTLAYNEDFTFSRFTILYHLYTAVEWRRNCSGCSGFGRYTFQPYINIHSPYFNTFIAEQSPQCNATLENDEEVVFGMHETCMVTL